MAVQAGLLHRNRLHEAEDLLAVLLHDLGLYQGLGIGALGDLLLELLQNCLLPGIRRILGIADLQGRAPHLPAVLVVLLGDFLRLFMTDIHSARRPFLLHGGDERALQLLEKALHDLLRLRLQGVDVRLICSDHR